MTLEYKDVTVTRNGRDILADTSGTIQAGQFTAFCGPNGAGKTTAMNTATGSLRPDQGVVFLDGQPVANTRKADIARRRAVVMQSSALSFPFHVHEVVAMGRAPHFGQSSPSKDDHIVEQALDTMHLGAFIDRNYLTLSGGERKRVDIARALAQVWDEPRDGATRWLFLDEPTSALDLKYQILLMERLMGLARDGWGVIAVLHDLHLVKRYADKVWLFKDGRLHDRGGPENVLSAQNIENAFDLDAPYAFDAT